jgi:hypothetical protein
VRNGVTVAVIQEGNVLVASATSSAASTDSGNDAAALALVRAGLRHLARVTPRA